MNEVHNSGWFRPTCPDSSEANRGDTYFRSDVFSMILQEKKYALEVYNCLNDSAYEDPEEIEIVTLENGISLSMRNDAAFIIGAYINIYEHQSTYNPNMPLRSLLYIAKIFGDMVKNRDLFSRKLIRIPAPSFVVFYNGNEKRPEYEEQRLSDAFESKGEEANLELVCKVYNINLGNNGRILNRCKVLQDYSIFVERVRDNIRNGSPTPIEDAIEYCLENHILGDFLRRRGKEVIKSMAIDMTFERREVLIREEERADGIEIGRAEGMNNVLVGQIISKVKKNKPLAQIADELETDVEAIENIYQAVVDAAPDYNVDEIMNKLN